MQYFTAFLLLSLQYLYKVLQSFIGYRIVTFKYCSILKREIKNDYKYNRKGTTTSKSYFL